jgi:hypothetical protein
MRYDEIKVGDRLLVQRKGETVPVEVIKLQPERDSFWVQIAQDIWVLIECSAVVGRSSKASTDRSSK